jgi:heptosyltransferase-2
VVAVFGATDETRTAPLSAGAASASPVILTHPVFCRPCMLRECPIDHRCMRGVAAQRVLDALAPFLSPP